MRVLASLGIADHILAVAAHPIRREVRLWSSGRAWPTFELNTVAAAVYGQPFAWLFRPDLLEVLARAVMEEAPDTIKLGHKVADCQQADGRVTLLLTDGGHLTGDVLVGAAASRF